MQDTEESESPGSSHRQRRKWLRRAILAAGAGVLLPYLYSRAASPFRSVVTFSESKIDADVSVTPEKRHLRVLTYNIAHGRGLVESNWAGGDAAQRHDRLSKIAQVLRDANADVVVLNEVDFDSSWSHGVNQAKFLADAAGYPHRVEQRNLDFRVLWWRWKFGNVILSKHPLNNATLVDVPGFSSIETLVAGQKRCVRVEIEFAGESITIVGAHLCHRSEKIRTASADVLTEIARANDGKTIVAGDFNSTPPGFPHAIVDGRNAIDSLDASGLFRRHPTETPKTPDEFTFRSRDTRTLIDWVLIPAVADFEQYTIVGVELSDHHPVCADIRFDSNE